MLYKKDIKRSFNTETDDSNQEQLFTLQFRIFFVLFFSPWELDHRRTWKCLKWYYDQKIISFFSSDFESVFAKHPTGKILSFVFYPKAVYFVCKFWI